MMNLFVMLWVTLGFILWLECLRMEHKKYLKGYGPGITWVDFTLGLAFCLTVGPVFWIADIVRGR